MGRILNVVLVCLLAAGASIPTYGQDRSTPKAAASQPKAGDDAAARLKPASVEGLKAVTTKSGLKYYDFKVGDGPRPLIGATLMVHYSIWVADGALLHTTRKLPGPATMLLKGVCDGWEEGVSSMRVGGKRRLEVPPELGLGEIGGHNVPPNSTLIFEVELLGVVQLPHLAEIGDIDPQTTESGVKYWDVKKGNGPSPLGRTPTMKLRYTGWLDNGTVFGSTEERKEEYTYTRMDMVVPGLREGLRTMKVGGVRWIQIPPELGFGDAGNPPKVGPEETLIFRMELFQVIQPAHFVAVSGVEPLVTASGLRYWDIEVGEGDSPGPTSTVMIHYNGWAGDGRMFDSTVERGEALTVRLNRVVKGLQEGIRSMKVGGVRWMELPPELGFGDEGHPDYEIHPGEKLFFEVRLMGVRE